MADLSSDPNAAPELLPGFLQARSQTGSLELRWVPFPADELHVWVLLTDPTSLVPSALRPEALLRELIRVPADAATGVATVYVPVDRPLGVLLMGRDSAGRPCPVPPFTVRSGAPVARAAVQENSVAAVSTAGKSDSAAPKNDGKAIPLVFARGRDPIPDLGNMARRIADRVGVRAPAAPVVPILATVVTTAPVTPNPPSLSLVASPTARLGFGAKQRWTLTRLGFAPGTPQRTRVVVVRPTFLDATTIAQWEVAPPADAIALPADADGLVDALSADDAMAFYALFEQTIEGWQSLPLTLLNPPFDESVVPFAIGDVAARLAHLATRPTTSDAHASLVAAALRVLATTSTGSAPSDEKR